LSRYLRELRRRGLSLLIYDQGGEGVLYSSVEGGIRPLIDAVESLGLRRLRGCIVVDKVVGRATALIAAYINASEVHAVVMSWGAEKILHRFGIPHSFLVETPYIKGKRGGRCPFERIVEGVDDPEEAYKRVRGLLSRGAEPGMRRGGL